MDVFREISLAYFSPSHLAKVSATCRTLRALASDIMHWRNKVLFLEGAEFQSSEILQRISPAYGVASAITVTCKQLCLFDTVPSNAYVTMQTECIRLPGATDAVMSGFRSTGPLMGRAELDLILPRSACGIYIGVREWRGARRSYCRIDNLFQNNTTWSYGLNGEMPRPHFGRERHQILPLSVNRFEIEWSSHSFEIWLNRAGVSRVFTNMEAAPHLSELFVGFSGETTEMPLNRKSEACHRDSRYHRQLSAQSVAGGTHSPLFGGACAILAIPGFAEVMSCSMPTGCALAAQHN